MSIGRTTAGARRGNEKSELGTRNTEPQSQRHEGSAFRLPRSAFLQRVPSGDSMTWTKPKDTELKQRLDREQYAVTQCDATEPPFQNKYWDNHEPGIYVDV